MRYPELLTLLEESVAMREVARRIKEIGAFDLSLVGMIEDRTEMVHRAWSGTETGALHNLTVPEGRGLGGRSLQLRQPFWVRDYCQSDSITHDYDSLVRAEGIKGMLAVPLVYDDELLGAVYVGTRQEFSFGDQAIDRVVEIASTASISLRNAQLVKRQTGTAVGVERRRVAVELHDSVGPLLFRIGAELRKLRSAQDHDGVLQRIDEVERQVADVASVLRNCLATLDEQPRARELAVALQQDCEAFEERTGVPCRYLGPSGLRGIDANRRQALVSAGREALHNVEKHAQASLVVVSVTEADTRITLAVADDGGGTVVDNQGSEGAGHFGLPRTADRMERVGGALSVVGNEDGGLTVRAWVPRLAAEGDENG